MRSKTFGNPKVFSFRILNPNKNIMYDDLLGPDLVSELSVFPAQERDEEKVRVLILETDSETVTIDMILEIFRQHNVEAELIDQKQKFT